jgi:hypothetical protein
MKPILASLILIATMLSGCTTVVMTESYEAIPTTIVTEVYYSPVVTYTTAQYCYWDETPVYGYADVYRDGQTHVRLKQVAYVDRQWRCH